MKRSTLTLTRQVDDDEVYVTVELLRVGSGWIITEALDELGKNVKDTITTDELGDLVERADAGEDETGY